LRPSPACDPGLEGLRRQIDAGLRGAPPLFRSLGAPDPRPVVVKVSGCPLGRFPDGALGCDGELVAAAVARVEAPTAGSAVLALDPEHALTWVAEAGDGADPIARFLALSGALLRAATSGLETPLGVRLASGPAALGEDSVVGILLATHAPSDTWVLSARVDLDAGGLRRPAHAYWLLDPKLLSASGAAG